MLSKKIHGFKSTKYYTIRKTVTVSAISKLFHKFPISTKSWLLKNQSSKYFSIHYTFSPMTKLNTIHSLKANVNFNKTIFFKLPLCILIIRFLLLLSVKCNLSKLHLKFFQTYELCIRGTCIFHSDKILSKTNSRVFYLLIKTQIKFRM